MPKQTPLERAIAAEDQQISRRVRRARLEIFGSFDAALGIAFLRSKQVDGAPHYVTKSAKGYRVLTDGTIQDSDQIVATVYAGEVA